MSPGAMTQRCSYMSVACKEIKADTPFPEKHVSGNLVVFWMRCDSLLRLPYFNISFRDVFLFMAANAASGTLSDINRRMI